MSTWIKLHRKFVAWEWYNDSNMVHLFLHILLNANHKPNRWRGMELQRGQYLTGRKKLSKETGISERTVRTCLERLKSTNELTIKTTKQFSIITVCNYDKYQDKDLITDQVTDQQNANNRPTTDQQPTTIKNDKKEKNYKNILLSEIDISDFPNLDKELLEITKSFQQLFIDNLKEVGINNSSPQKAKGSWYDDIRLMVEVDGITVNDFRDLFKALKRLTFWKKNILSTGKLRKQAEKILIEYRTLKAEEERKRIAEAEKEKEKELRYSLDDAKRTISKLNNDQIILNNINKNK